MRIEIIEWDDANLEHATRHGVSAEEIEQALTNPTGVRRNRRGGSGTHLILGTTAGGRRVEVVITYRASTHSARPITAWEATK